MKKLQNLKLSMKKLLFIVVYVVFARSVFAQTPQPLSENYIGCPGYTVIAGFEEDPNITYDWYGTSTGGARIFSNKYTHEFEIDTSFPFDGVTFFVQPIINGVATGPRIPVTVTRSENCGTQTPTGCYSTGILLFKQDFGGNDPSDPIVSPVGLPAGITSYIYNANLNTGNWGHYRLSKVSPTAGSWYTLYDHTYEGDPSRGYMFVTDAKEGAGQFYQHEVSNLCPGSRLSFSAWLVSLCRTNHTSKTNIQFVVEDLASGKILARFYTGDLPDGEGVWKNYGFNFVPTSSNIRLRIINNNYGNSTMGNDFALDDIEIRICVPEVIMPGDDIQVCVGDTFSLTPTIINNDGLFIEPIEYQWYFSLDGDVNNPASWSPLSNQTALTLSINSVLPADIGYYRIAASGAGGINFENCRAISAPIYLSPGAFSTVEAEKCGLEPYWFDGRWLTETGVYIDTIQTTGGGCDSIVILTLIFSGGTGYISDTICEGTPYDFFGQNLTQTGIYRSDTMQNADGCDTVVELDLTVVPIIIESSMLSICQDELPYHYQNAAAGIDTIFYEGTASNTTVFRRQASANCEHIVTLNLIVDTYIHEPISATICQGEQYDFYGTMLSAPNTYTHTIAKASGCDTIITLTLIVNPTFAPNEILTICQTDLPKVWRDTTFEAGAESGIFTFCRQTINGCDSVVTLNLTVLESFTSEIDTFICSGESFILHGETYTTSGVYTIPLTSANNCDSTITLNLEVVDNVNVTVSISEKVCANNGEFTLTFTPTFPGAVLPTDYSIIFDSKTANAFGYNSLSDVITGYEISVPMPQKIYPDHYFLQITLSNNSLDCEGKTFDIPFSVLYPDSIMRQKWDNVIAILNEHYNGGFRFVDYQWYHKNDLIPDATVSYLYRSLVVDDEYSVELRRAGDTYSLFSCPFIAHSPYPNVSQYPTLVSPNGVIPLGIKGKSAVARIWSVTGILVANVQINYFGQEIYAPLQQGIYLLEIISDNQLREVVPIVVK